jgi:hypothetical protein
LSVALHSSHIVLVGPKRRYRIPEIDVWSINPYSRSYQTFNTFGKHQRKAIGPDVGLNVKKDIRIKARPSRIPLICKMSVIANVVPMWVTNLKTVIRINYRNSTIWPKHCFQLYGMLLSAWPVENERLNFHG